MPESLEQPLPGGSSTGRMRIVAGKYVTVTWNDRYSNVSVEHVQREQWTYPVFIVRGADISHVLLWARGVAAELLEAARRMEEDCG